MSKALKPSRLDVDPNSSKAAKEWKHWKRTFDNFITECGSEAPDKFRSIVNFISADVFDYVEECTTYDQVVDTLTKLYVKTPNAIFARHQLASRKQKSGETLDEYLEELKKLSKDCNFEAVTADVYKSEMIRDSFINGLSSNYIRQRLLENSKLTLTEAHEKARTLDLAQKNSEVYATSNPSSLAAATSEEIDTDSTLAAVQKQSKIIPRKKNCYFCGGHMHSNRSSCPAREATCHNCAKVGHFSKVCQSNAKSSTVSAVYSPTLCAITAACPPSLSHACIPVTIHGQQMDALIDSCSSDNFISENAFQKLKVEKFHSNRKISLALTSAESRTLGSCNLSIFMRGCTYNNVRLEILKCLCSDIILGYDFQKLHNSVTFNFGGSKPDLVVTGNDGNIAALINKNVNIKEFARVKPPSLFQNLSDTVKPIVTKSRSFNKDDRKFIENELRSLLEEGKIQKSCSPWRAQVLVAKDEYDRHRQRLCMDYSQTINLFTHLDAYPLPRIDDMVNKLSKYKVFSTYDLKSAYHQIPLLECERKYTAFECLGDLYEFVVIPFGVTNGVPCFQRIMDDLVASEGLTDTFPYLDNVTIGGMDEDELNKNDIAFKEMIEKRNIRLNHSKTVQRSTVIDILGYRITHKCIKPDPERLRPLIEFPVPSNSATLRRALGMFSYYAKWIPEFSDKIRILSQSERFPLADNAVESFQKLKDELGKVVLGPVDEDLPFVVECDASDVAVSASLNQNGRPVAFMSRTLSKSEKLYPAVEKEALAIIEAVRKWNHLLSRQPFTLVTDQRSVSYMFDNRLRTKIKNNKIQIWRMELAEFSYEIKYRKGENNVVPDSFTRSYCLAFSNTLKNIHDVLCHPGVARLAHYIKVHNLPYSIEDVKRVCSSCGTCAELKPRFFKGDQGRLIKATRPMERLSIDFKGPLPSASKNKYLLTVIDEYSRFPFAFPCPDMTTSTVINCLNTIFSLCGMPEYIHSDRGMCFMSSEFTQYLTSRGIASSHSTPYHPIGNGQVERYNGIIWKSVRLALETSKMPISHWEKVLPNVLSSVRCLLSTSTNTTPHERFFAFRRNSNATNSLPSWLTPGPVYMRKFVRGKHDDLVEKVELTHLNPTYASIRHDDGREANVSLSDLSPCPSSPQESPEAIHDVAPSTNCETSAIDEVLSESNENYGDKEIKDNANDGDKDYQNVSSSQSMESKEEISRYPLRTKRKPNYYGYNDL